MFKRPLIEQKRKKNLKTDIFTPYIEKIFKVQATFFLSNISK